MQIHTAEPLQLLARRRKVLSRPAPVKSNLTTKDQKALQISRMRHSDLSSASCLRFRLRHIAEMESLQPTPHSCTYCQRLQINLGLAGTELIEEQTVENPLGLALSELEIALSIWGDDLSGLAQAEGHPTLQ